MAVFRTITLQWGDASYTLTPSNRLLRQMESEGVSVVSLISQMSQANPPIASLAYVLAVFLREGGASITEDEVYGQITQMLADGREDDFLRLCVSVVEAITPQAMGVKKPDAPAPKAATGRKRSPR